MFPGRREAANPHLQLPDMSRDPPMALGTELLWQSRLDMLMDRNNRLDNTGMLLEELTQSQLCLRLQVLSLTDNCFQEGPRQLLEGEPYRPLTWGATDSRVSPVRWRSLRI
ncbi:Leucine-rich repeat-containing protein 58 [Cricetulus griseus]|nr:Leucine-rich repeat-containing protein 58 [Cricetulus griseus]